MACTIKLLFLFLFVPGTLCSGNVTLESLLLFTCHNWAPLKTIVYFDCKGEVVKVLPDVIAADIIYTFKGEESWQPTTEFSDKKCKRCGVFQRNPVADDDALADWEFCPQDFVGGRYNHFKENMLNATFLCEDCVSSSNSTATAGWRSNIGTRVRLAIIITISLVVFVVLITIAILVYKHFQKKKRAKQQANFLKLFEDDDDIEDELGLARII